MHELTEVIDTHLAGYCEPDPTTRAELLGRAWAPQGTLIDPPFDGSGLPAIAGMVDAVLTHYPDHRFVRTTAVDAHHTSARYGWALVASDGQVALEGVDFADLDEENRLVRVVGYFGPLAPVG